MKRLGVYAMVLGVVVVAILAGWIAADWPRWCTALAWCAPGFPQ
jgi:hypothetical protein